MNDRTKIAIARYNSVDRFLECPHLDDAVKAAAHRLVRHHIRKSAVREVEYNSDADVITVRLTDEAGILTMRVQRGQHQPDSWDPPTGLLAHVNRRFGLSPGPWFDDEDERITVQSPQEGALPLTQGDARAMAAAPKLLALAALVRTYENIPGDLRMAATALLRECRPDFRVRLEDTERRPVPPQRAEPGVVSTKPRPGNRPAWVVSDVPRGGVDDDEERANEARADRNRARERFIEETAGPAREED